MNVKALGHNFETISDGLTVLKNGVPAPVPLMATRIAVEIVAGLATIRTTRSFRNTEVCPIEAVLTMPVGFDAVVTGLRTTVDGRSLTALAKLKESARADYEAAIDRGKMAVLHEEALRGVHILSVAQLAPGKEVLVELETVVALTTAGDALFLRIPVTVGQLYGTSPFAPADDLVISEHVRHAASLSVTSDTGRVLLDEGRWIGPDETCEIMLDAAIELRVPGGRFGTRLGVAADGRQVRIDLLPTPAGDGALDLAVLVDRSGSTGGRARGTRGLTVWQAIRDGLHAELSGLRRADRIALWQFDTSCDLLGSAVGDEAAKLTMALGGPAGGTELGEAISKVLTSGTADILVLTDGQTWAQTVDALRGSKARISAILVGSGSLDANIGQLCAQTGGQLFYAAGDDVAAPLARAFATLRQTGGAVEGVCTSGSPVSVAAVRGGVAINASWSDAMELTKADAVGRYAAALALPLMSTEQADTWAVNHTLCTHRISLILIDDAGETVNALSQMRKVPLMSEPKALRRSHSSIGEAMSAATCASSEQVMFYRAPKALSLSSPSTHAPSRGRHFKGTPWISSIGIAFVVAVLLIFLFAIL